MDGIKITGPEASWAPALSANECNAKPLRIPSQIFWIHACELPSGSFPGNIIICWKRVFIQLSSRCLKRCQKHRLQKYANEEIKFRKFVPRKLIQVGKKWSYKLFEILNRSFIHQIVWNFTNPLVLTFLGFLLIYRFQTRGTGSGPKIQIRKHSWRKRKSELGEKCSKQTGSGSFVVACPQLRSLCPLGAIAYVWPKEYFFAKLTTRVGSNFDGVDKTAMEAKFGDIAQIWTEDIGLSLSSLPCL